MSDKKWSAEDILMEMGASGKKQDREVDVDSLLQDILHEESYIKKSAPAPEPPLPGEAPTKRFKRSRKTGGESVPSQNAFQKSSIAQKIEATGKLFIDVDKIRSEQPKPRMIPADPLETEESGEKTARTPKISKEIRFNQEKEDVDFEDKLEFTPSFAVFEPYDTEDQLGKWNELIGKRRKKELLKCLILFSLFGAAMLLSFLMQTMRKDGVALSPVIPWVITGLGVVGGAVGYDILLGGFRSLFSFRPDRDILPALCFTVTLLHSAAMSALKDAFLSPNIQLYLPLGLLSLAVCCAGRLNLLKAAFRNLRMIQAEGGKYVPHKISDSRLAGELTRGMIDQFPVTAVNQRSDGLRDFLKFSFSADRSDLLSRNLAVIGLCAAAVCGVFTYLFNRDVPFAFTAATVSFGVFAPAMNALITAFPLKNVSGLMARAGGMVASEKSALEYENVNSVLLDAQSLFPPSMVVLSGIKTFAGMRIDEAIVDAASVLREAGSIFSGIFFKMIGGNVSLLRPVEQLSYEDNLGLSAWVNNKRLLIGNREFLENHGVTMPSEDYEKRFIAEGSELLYLASAGDLTAVFVVSIHASIQTEDACQMLADNGIGMSIRTIDPIVRPEILEKLFSVAPYFFKIVPGRLHENCRRLSEDVIGRPAMTVNNGTALSLACSLCASKRLKIFITVLQLIQTISILVNIVTVAVLSFLGNFSGLTGLVAAAAQLGWMLIGLLIQRSFRI